MLTSEFFGPPTEIIDQGRYPLSYPLYCSGNRCVRGLGRDRFAKRRKRVKNPFPIFKFTFPLIFGNRLGEALVCFLSLSAGFLVITSQSRGPPPMSRHAPAAVVGSTPPPPLYGRSARGSLHMGL